nr:MerR family DNA-binding transcriptional regulator [Catellatospora sichuanensis]
MCRLTLRPLERSRIEVVTRETLQELWPIGRFALATGLSVPTLRHYDEIGLLPPAHVGVHRPAGARGRAAPGHGMGLSAVHDHGSRRAPPASVPFP